MFLKPFHPIPPQLELLERVKVLSYEVDLFGQLGCHEERLRVRNFPLVRHPMGVS